MVHSFPTRRSSELLDGFEDRATTRRTVAPLLEPLSEREQAILRYLPTTLSNREIAAELFISIKTVETHASNVLRKLQLSSRHQLTRWAAERRLT